MHVEPDVGVGHRDVGSLSCLFPELVNDGTVHLTGYEFGVSELFREHHRVNGKALFQVQVLAPVHCFDGVIHLVGGCGFEVFDGLQHLDGRAQLEVCPVHQFFVSFERNHTSPDFDVVGTQCCQLLRQDGLQSHECLGYEFKFLFHY